MASYNFEKFDGTYHRGDDKIVITKSGLIRLSAGFCRVTNLIPNKYKYVVLFYDKVNRAIGMKFLHEHEIGALSLTRDKAAMVFAAKAFFLTYALDLLLISGRYSWKKELIIGHGEVYIVDVKNNGNDKFTPF